MKIIDRKRILTQMSLQILVLLRPSWKRWTRLAKAAGPGHRPASASRFASLSRKLRKTRRKGKWILRGLKLAGWFL